MHISYTSINVDKRYSKSATSQQQIEQVKFEFYGVLVSAVARNAVSTNEYKRIQTCL
jgi:hypothetical protein